MHKRIIPVFIITIVLTLFSCQFLYALKLPELKGRINDYADVLTREQETELENFLINKERTSSSQIVLLTIQSLEGNSIEDFSLGVAEKWKLGQKASDNGVLLLIAIKEKKLRIEAGYGLEPVLTDAKCGFIIRNVIVPGFKQGNFYQGIKAGLSAISGVASNEFKISDKEIAQYDKQRKKSSKGHLPIGLIIFLIMAFAGGFGRRGRRGKAGGILPWIVVGSMLGGSKRFGGGFSTGGFGGGFSGGGGSFGGGGASGGW